MKKVTKGFLIITICMLSIHSNAQIAAIRGGFNLSTLSVSDGFGEKFKSTPGFHLGATFDIPLGDMFAIETGILLTTKGGQSENSLFGSGSYKEIYNILNTEVPLSFKTIFGVNDNLDVYISAGGYLGVAVVGVYRYEVEINGQTEKDEAELNFGEGGFNRLDYGLTFGAGIEIKGLILGASYDLGLADITNSEWYIWKNRVLKFSIGYRFGWDN